jgi:hypothetical protein
MTINERLAELRECAQADGITINEESVRDFLAFPGINGATGPAIFLDDDGHLRATWRLSMHEVCIDFDGNYQGRIAFWPRPLDLPGENKMGDER